MPASLSVVARVAAREGVDETELLPLFDAVDPDALDKLFETAHRNVSTVEVTFSYHGYEVTVTGDGAVHLD